MNKPHESSEPQALRRAFVSSTFADLREVREEVRTALRRAGYLDIAMEYMVAEDTRPVDKCLALVRDCDVFISIIAWRYGSVVRPHTVSVTELEYETALKSGKPCLIFLLSEEAPWPVSWIDPNRRRIEMFRRRLSEAHVVAFFSGRADIAGRLLEALWTHESAAGVRGVLVQTADRFQRVLEEIRDRQERHCESFRLFEFQEDIAVERIYVQEILQPKTQKSPYDQLHLDTRQRSKPIPEAEVLKNIRENKSATAYIFEGRAGAGKSTMLKMWLLQLLRYETPIKPRLFPLFCSLRHLGRRNGTPGQESIVAAVCDSTPGLEPRSVRLLFDPEISRFAAPDLSLLLLLDALDEMESSGRREFLASLGALPKNLHPVVTTRPGILTETGYPVKSHCFELCDFDGEQIAAFVGKWFAHDPELGDKLLDRLEKSPKLKGLASIPLLLTCVAIHVELYRELRLPDQTVESVLLRESVEILIDRWDAAREGRAPDPTFIGICFEIFSKMSEYPKHVDVPWTDFLRVVESAARGHMPTAHVVSRIANNGRILAGGVREGVHFSHSIFYDFFFAERLTCELGRDRVGGDA